MVQALKWARIWPLHASRMLSPEWTALDRRTSGIPKASEAYLKNARHISVVIKIHHLALYNGVIYKAGSSEPSYWPTLIHSPGFTNLSFYWEIKINKSLSQTRLICSPATSRMSGALKRVLLFRSCTLRRGCNSRGDISVYRLNFYYLDSLARSQFLSVFHSIQRNATRALYCLAL